MLVDLITGQRDRRIELFKREQQNIALASPRDFRDREFGHRFLKSYPWFGGEGFYAPCLLLTHFCEHVRELILYRCVCAAAWACLFVCVCVRAYGCVCVCSCLSMSVYV